MATPIRRRTPPQQTLLEAVDASVKANPHIDSAVDAAVIASARKVAKQIDDVLEAQQLGAASAADVSKAMYLMPHLMNCMKEMMATPASRVKFPGKGEGGGKLGQLRDASKGTA